MPTTMNLIAKQTVGSAGAASITFSNIPQTFTDLKLVMSWRNTAQAVQQSNAHLTFNGATSRYYEILLYTPSVSNPASVSRQNAFPYLTWFGSGNGASTTANTFGSTETYICNYTSSDPKSISSDGVTENNAVDAWMLVTAGLWNPTTNAPITSITLTCDVNAFREFSEFTLYGISSNTTTQNPTVPSANGGDIISTDGTYWYHTFLYSGTFSPSKSLTCDYLVVAGGAGGGYEAGGGGGAGGYRYLTSQPLTAQAYAVIIGAGGTGANSGSTRGASGSTSTFGSTSSSGGGGGGGNPSFSGGSGGSGGGSRSNSNTSGGAGNAGSYSPVEGYAGGSTTGSSGSGGGGGSGGNAGTGVDTSAGGNGGIATANSITGSSIFYAGGGGGGVNSISPTARGLGGGTSTAAQKGGGGDGGFHSSGPISGTANTGGGGGGGDGSSNVNGAAGGSGIVIVRYAV